MAKKFKIEPINKRHMTLHEAMEKLLREAGRGMTKDKIAEKLNKNKWYQKEDCSEISPNQISARASTYPEIFHRKGGKISLVNRNRTQQSSSKEVSKAPKNKKQIHRKNITLVEKELLDQLKIKLDKSIDISSAPQSSGIYCIQIKDKNRLPERFNEILSERNHNILYFGIAKNLKERLEQELFAKGHGTFFRSLGALLGYRPEKGSLVGKKNQKNYNYRFPKRDEQKIIKWIINNLAVNWVELEEDALRSMEKCLIKKHLPLLNLSNNPAKIQIIEESREECIRIAKSEP